MNEIERPAEVIDLIDQFHGRERALSALFVLLVMAVYLVAYFSTPLLVSTGIAIVILLIVRTPIYQSYGSIKLQTPMTETAVIESFSGPTPPVLGFQWGVADAISIEDGTVNCETSYLFGVRSVIVAIDATVDDTSDGKTRVTLDVTEDETPWGTYTCTITTDGEHAIVDIDYRSNRRFGLRRLPQQLLASRYRDAILETQGFAVVERESHVGL
ncbi:hypothetical protein [Halocatena halophila]|uniref:hypothetical protein n=1 Tax=Halocatena halophila TaxID=2814576 RepID=UPI002ECFBA86